jgi:regulator of nonsense transcripts 2
VIQKEKKILDPMEAYLLDLIVVRLVPDDRKIVAAKKQITRLPWSDPRKNCGRLVTKYILKACRKGRYNSVRALAGLLLSLKRDKPEIYIRVLDTLYEEVQFALEVPNPRDHQRILSYARLLGEMCSRGLVGLPAIITQLYNIVNYGHDIPSALREACNRLEPATDESLSLRTISSKLLKGPSGVNQTIMEDEEFEEGSLNGERVVVEQVNNKPVAISPFSQFDPRVPSSIDPPSAVFRIKLVCTLLDSCVSTIGNHNKAMLNQFLASFQRYIFTKSSVPADIEFSVLDTFDLIDSKLRAINMDLNSRKIPEGYGIVRYKSWVDAHNATISYEEKDAIAESISESTALNSSGIQKAASAGEEILMNEDVACSSESDDEEDDNDYQDSIHDQSTDDNDVDVFDEDLNDDASRSTGIIEQQSNDEKDEAEGSDYDVNSVTDEDEIDEEIQQKERAQKLEEEMFEQELRRITLEAIEKGKVAARTGFGGKVSDAMPSASQYIRKKGSDLSGDTEDNFMKTLSGGTGVQFNFLKKGHKGRVEARSLIVPSDSNIAKVASKQDDKTIREKNILKARVLQYEVENSELFPPLPLNYGPRTKDRHRPLSMEDINQNFGSSKE